MLARSMNSLAPLMAWSQGMNRLFEGFFDDMPGLRGYATGYPGMNLWSDGDTAYVEAELPGLTLEDLEVLVAGNELTISGQRKIESPQNAQYHRRERASGQFTRSMTLPWEIDADKVQAKLHDGVLTVTLPKCESCKPKRVKILPES